jgi:hypothetical protein
MPKDSQNQSTTETTANLLKPEALVADDYSAEFSPNKQALFQAYQVPRIQPRFLKDY